MNRTRMVIVTILTITHPPAPTFSFCSTVSPTIAATINAPNTATIRLPASTYTKPDTRAAAVSLSAAAAAASLRNFLIAVGAEPMTVKPPIFKGHPFPSVMPRSVY